MDSKDVDTLVRAAAKANIELDTEYLAELPALAGVKNLSIDDKKREENCSHE